MRASGWGSWAREKAKTCLRWALGIWRTKNSGLVFLGPFTCCLWLGLVALHVEYHVPHLVVGRLQLSLGLLNRQVWGFEFHP